MTRITRNRLIMRGVLPLIAFFAVLFFVYPAAANLHLNTGRQSRVQAFQPQTVNPNIKLVESVQLSW